MTTLEICAQPSQQKRSHATFCLHKSVGHALPHPQQPAERDVCSQRRQRCDALPAMAARSCQVTRQQETRKKLHVGMREHQNTGCEQVASMRWRAPAKRLAGAKEKEAGVGRGQR